MLIQGFFEAVTQYEADIIPRKCWSNTTAVGSTALGNSGYDVGAWRAWSGGMPPQRLVPVKKICDSYKKFGLFTLEKRRLKGDETPLLKTRGLFSSHGKLFSSPIQQEEG